MYSSDKFEPPLLAFETIPIDPTQFETPDGLALWVEQQKRNYTELIGNRLDGDPTLQAAWDEIVAPFNLVQSRFSKWKATDIGRENYESVFKRLADFFENGRLHEVGTPASEFLNSVSKTNPAVGARATALLARTNLNLLQSNQIALWLEAGALVANWKYGSALVADGEGASLSHLRETWRGKFVQTIDEIKQSHEASTKRLEDINRLAEHTDDLVKKHSADADLVFEQTSRKTTDAVKEAEEQIAAFTSAYNQALALRAPTNYWKEKRDSHRLAAAFWFLAFFVFSILGVIGIWFVWHVTVELKYQNQNEIPYTAFIPSIGAALLAAWFMRMFSRQMISNLSLSADANERVAMVKTYLALTEGGHAKDSDRGLILSSLFRSAPKSGDDGAPPTLADAATKVLRGERP